MTRWILATMLAMLIPPGGARAATTYACNMNALTRTERAAHTERSRLLLGRVEKRRELPGGYAFRLPAGTLVDAAEWVSLERRCCPFFAFAIECAGERGPVWLSVTGGAGIKPFIRAEFGLDDAH